MEGSQLQAIRHLVDMVRGLDAEIKHLLRAQVIDESAERYGGFLTPWQHVEPRQSGFGFSRLMLGYISRESSHYLSANVEQALRACLVYMEHHQRPDEIGRAHV